MLYGKFADKGDIPVNNQVKEDNLMFISFEGNNCIIILKLLLEVYNLGAFFRS